MCVHCAQKPDTYCCIRSICDRLGLYAEIQIFLLGGGDSEQYCLPTSKGAPNGEARRTQKETSYTSCASSNQAALQALTVTQRTEISYVTTQKFPVQVWVVTRCIPRWLYKSRWTSGTLIKFEWRRLRLYLKQRRFRTRNTDWNNSSLLLNSSFISEQIFLKCNLFELL